MGKNLPEKPTAILESMGGQAALFDDPARLLGLADAELRQVALAVGREGGTIFAQVRRAAGLVAWAGWHRFSEKAYEEFMAGIAGALGVEVQTLRSWRRAVVAKDNLAVPAVVEARTNEAKARPQKPRSEPVRVTAITPSAAAPPAPAARPKAPPPTPAAEVPAGQVDVDAIGLRWLKSKTTGEIRAIGDPWGPAIRSEVKRWAEAFGLAIVGPATTAPAMPVSIPLDRQEVTPMFKKTR